VVNKKLLPSDVSVTNYAQSVKPTMALLIAMDNIKFSWNRLESMLEQHDMVNLRMIHSTLCLINMNCTDLIYIVSNLSWERASKEAVIKDGYKGKFDRQTLSLYDTLPLIKFYKRCQIMSVFWLVWFKPNLTTNWFSFCCFNKP